MNTFKQKLSTSVLILSLLFPVLFSVFLNPNTAKAQLVPFGGIITSAIPCPCSRPFAYMLTVSPPVPGTVMYVPSVTRLYPFYQIIRPGPFVLGIYYPGSIHPCLVFVPFGCASIGGGPIINLVGTSM